jgi:hypothetical protein
VDKGSLNAENLQLIKNFLDDGPQVPSYLLTAQSPQALYPQQTQQDYLQQVPRPAIMALPPYSQNISGLFHNPSQTPQQPYMVTSMSSSTTPTPTITNPNYT